MSALSYRDFTRAPFTDPPFADFLRWDMVQPVGSTNLDPTIWNYVAYPTPGTYAPPSVTNTGGLTNYVSNSTANTAVLPRNVLQFGDGVSTLSGEFSLRLDRTNSAGLAASDYIDSMFCDPQRLGWTVEFWLWLDRSSVTSGNPVLLHIGNGIPSATVPLFELQYHMAALSGTADAPTPSSATNGLLLRTNNTLYTCAVVSSFTARDIGNPVAVDWPKSCAGWHHCAVVESKIDNTMRFYIAGVQRGFASGVNITTPTFKTPYANNTIVQVGNSTARTKFQMANLIFHRYPKYLSGFTPPNLTNFTFP